MAVGKNHYAGKTRHVYNGPHTSNLSKPQQTNFWSKIIFEQQNQKKIPEFFFFQKKNFETNFSQKENLKKNFGKKF